MGSNWAVTPAARGLTKGASRSYLQGMRAVGLKVLKNKLSEYVRLAAGGETILITDRDTVVAELNPPAAGRSPEVADAVLADLVLRGLVTPARKPFTEPPPRKPIATLKQILKWLDESRADRRYTSA